MPQSKPVVKIQASVALAALMRPFLKAAAALSESWSWLEEGPWTERTSLGGRSFHFSVSSVHTAAGSLSKEMRAYWAL